MIDLSTLGLPKLEQQYGLPNGLLSAVAQVESAGNPNAVSSKGAQGLFQFEPATAKQYGIDPTDPQQSAIGAAKYYADLLKQNNGNLDAALASYNFGPGNVAAGKPLPSETQNYISKVKSLLPQAAAVPAGRDLSGELFGSSQPSQGKDLSAELFGASPTEKPSKNYVEDIAKSAVLRGVPEGLAASTLLGYGTNVIRGVSDLARLGIDKAYSAATGNTVLPIPNPVPTSSDMLQWASKNILGKDLYEPQTIPGQYANTIAQFGAGGKVLGVPLATSIPAAVASETAGQATKGTQYETLARLASAILTAGLVSGRSAQPALKTAADESAGNLNIIPKAQEQAGGVFAKKVNAFKSGIEANKAISRQYELDTGLQRQLYSDLNQKGSVFSIKTPDLYNKLDDLTSSLKNQVAIDTPEARALNELEDISGNLQSKYAIKGKTSPILDASGNPIVTASQGATGIEPSDLVQIKTTLNSGLKPNKFTTAGSAKILALKKYVNDALGQASSANPEFGTALKSAEAQAKRVGLYKEDALRPLWQPEDYVAYKSGSELPADTISRASKFLENLNNKATGRAAAVSNILPEKDAIDVIKNSIKLGRQNQPSYLKSAVDLATLRPISALKNVAKATLDQKSLPLEDLAKNIRAMQLQKLKATPTPPNPLLQLIKNTQIPPYQGAILRQPVAAGVP